MNEEEQRIKNIYKNIGVDAVFYEYGGDNIDLGLSDTNKVYIDTISPKEKTANIAYQF